MGVSRHRRSMTLQATVTSLRLLRERDPHSHRPDGPVAPERVGDHGQLGVARARPSRPAGGRWRRARGRTGAAGRRSRAGSAPPNSRTARGRAPLVGGVRLATPTRPPCIRGRAGRSYAGRRDRSSPRPRSCEWPEHPPASAFHHPRVPVTAVTFRTAPASPRWLARISCLSVQVYPPRSASLRESALARRWLGIIAAFTVVGEVGFVVTFEGARHAVLRLMMSAGWRDQVSYDRR